jgi:hypothetical protein
MTPASRALLTYLDRYLNERPGRRPALRKMHLKKTGKAITDGHLWKHCKARVQPGIDTTLVYLAYLAGQGELLPAPRAVDLFALRRPEMARRK